MSPAEQPFRQILVASDFSASAGAALKQAVWLARQSDARLVLAHTLSDLRRAVHSASYKAKMDLFQGDGELLQQEMRYASDTKMRWLISNLSAIDVDVKFKTLLGEPFVEIIHAVQQDGYELVLAGTRGHAAWEQFFIGSTARRLIRKCPASVWIVRHEHVEPPTVILAPTDFSDVSRKAVLQGLWLAEKAGAKFHLLHVIDSKDVPENVAEHIPPGSSMRQEIDEEAQRRLDEFLASLNTDRSRIQAHLTWGTPWQEIQHLAEYLKVDLIAMGTVGRSGIKGLLLGNTAERVLSACPCSILTVKPDGFVSPIEPP